MQIPFVMQCDLDKIATKHLDVESFEGLHKLV